MAKLRKNTIGCILAACTVLAGFAASAQEQARPGFENAPTIPPDTATAGECASSADARLDSASEAPDVAVDEAMLSQAFRELGEAAGTADPACMPGLCARLHALRRLGDRAELAAFDEGTTIAEALRQQAPQLELKAGDVLLLRSPQVVSAAVGQIGLSGSDFSHAAIIGLAPVWRTLDVVEALAGDGVRTEALEEWLDKPFVRFAVLRHRVPEIAQRAAVAAYTDASERVADDLWYDFKLILDDSQRLYCTEVIRQAYARAAPQAAPVPQHLSDVGALVETFPMQELGATGREVFLADDLQLDPRFETILELRAPAAVARSERMDQAFRAIFARLRGPQREAALAEIDAAIPPGPLAVSYAFGGGYFEYQRLPPASRGRIAGLANLVTQTMKADESDR